MRHGVHRQLQVSSRAGPAASDRIDRQFSDDEIDERDDVVIRFLQNEILGVDEIAQNLMTDDRKALSLMGAHPAFGQGRTDDGLPFQ